MSFTPQTGATNNSVSTITTLGASGGVRAIGDVVCVSITWGLGGTGTSGVVDDNGAGLNTFTKVKSVSDANQQVIEEWVCVVTAPATVTARMRFNPTPGTSTALNGSINVDPFTGSDSLSAADGAGAAQAQASPTTTTDLLTSGSWTTTKPGDLIHTSSVDTVTGGDPGAPGTGFTLLQTSGGVIIKSAYKVQPSAGSIAGLWTAAVNEAHITAAMAITPAASGGGAYTDQPRKDMPLQQRVA